MRPQCEEFSFGRCPGGRSLCEKSLLGGVCVCHLCVRGPCVGFSIAGLTVPYERQQQQMSSGTCPFLLLLPSASQSLWYFADRSMACMSGSPHTQNSPFGA